MVTLAGAEHHKHEVFESRAEFNSEAIQKNFEVLRFLNLQTPNNWGVPSIIQDIEIHSGRLYKNFKQLISISPYLRQYLTGVSLMVTFMFQSTHQLQPWRVTSPPPPEQ